MKFKKYFTWNEWQFLYIVTGLTWLLAPAINHAVSHQGATISQFEASGMPWAWLFRLGDMLSGVLLAFATYKITIGSTKRAKFIQSNILLLSIIALGIFIDGALAVTHSNSGLISSNLLNIIHDTESVVTAITIAVLTLLWAIQKDDWSKYAFVFQVVLLVFIVIDKYSAQIGTTLAQVIYEIITSLWIARTVVRLIIKKPATNTNLRNVLVKLIGGWLFIGGLLSIITAVAHVEEFSEFSSIYFGNNSAWLTQHSIVIGIVLMYISRHLWRGEYRAWQLATLLLWGETIKYSVLSPNVTLVIAYGVTAALLYTLRSYFTRASSIDVLKQRLVTFLVVIVFAISALIIGITYLKVEDHQSFRQSSFDTARFMRHLLLVDTGNNHGTLKSRLLGQVVNIAGISFVLALLVSIFKPQKPPLAQNINNENQQVLDLLKQYSNSSEDYFKYWPSDKAYWWTKDHSSCIAYKVVGNVAFALADPVARTNAARTRANKEFLLYCRENGWRACFLMVREQQKNIYAKNEYKIFKIGASSEVSIDKFCNETSKGKWWRWIHNKAKRQNWEYEIAAPPHASELLAEIKYVSDKWLQRPNHVERGFALGYFDVNYLQDCKLHLLKEDGKVIAFANQVPTYGGVSSTTIDLMRFLPEVNHAIPTLMSYIIHELRTEGAYKTFDLGFVPLAAPTNPSEQAIAALGQLFMRGSVSAKGLEQFKNKFSPSWAPNYIAFDGDWGDLIHIGRYIDQALDQQML